MNFINWIFALLKKFVPITETEFNSMKIEADDWHTTVMDVKKPPSNQFIAWYRKNGSKWYIKLLLAVLYIPVSIWIGRQMNELNNPTPNLPNDLHDKIW